MILPDVNVLIYSVDESSPFHEKARVWWDELLSSTQPVGLCYPSILGFIRLTTNRRIFESPLNIDEALGYVENWISQPNTKLLLPTERHWPLLAQLLKSVSIGANMTTDAHIATYAIEHGYTLCSNDSDFSRFKGLRWENPLNK